MDKSLFLTPAASPQLRQRQTAAAQKPVRQKIKIELKLKDFVYYLKYPAPYERQLRNADIFLTAPS